MFKSKKDDVISQLKLLGYDVIDRAYSDDCESNDGYLQIVLRTDSGHAFGYILNYNTIFSASDENIKAMIQEIIRSLNDRIVREL